MRRHAGQAVRNAPPDRGNGQDMAEIAYILLCHRDPEGIAAQARRLTARGDHVAIHFDARAPAADFTRLKEALQDNPDVVFAPRVRCGWGEWSLVRATLNAIDSALAAFPGATHFYMVSGDCMPIKSAEHIHAFLDARDVDYIESFDFFTSDWIKTGMKEERLIYRHFVNERKHHDLFYRLLDWQKRLGLKRPLPRGIKVMIGSQWWCLRRQTVQAIVDFLKTRPDIIRFFRTTWIPDETFFQTLVRHLVPWEGIDSRTLTFLMFSDYGMPVTFYNDHHDMLVAQDFLFARKISPEARELKRRLGELYASGRTDFPVGPDGRRLYRYLAGQGRHGRRFGQRVWERGASLGRDRELLILVSKKWHVAKRLLNAIRRQTNIPGAGYLFNEIDAGLPDLGGLEGAMDKRLGHRRAFLRLLYEYHGSDRLLICLDPSDLDALRDFHADRCVTRILEIETRMDDAYLKGHAMRVGLADENSPEALLSHLLPTIRRELDFEVRALREAGFPDHHRIAEDATDAENAEALQRFLDVPAPVAQELARTPDLFAG